MSSAPGNDETANHGHGLSGLAHAESAADVTARYDGWVSDYEADVRSWGYVLPERIADLLMGETPAGSPLRVLDAGCGTGLVGQAIHATAGARHPDLDIVGVDASPESVEVAAQSRTSAGSSVYRDTQVVDLLEPLPFAAGDFGAVVCGGVLTYIPEPEPVLREFLRVTQPGAPVIVTQRTDLWAERHCDAIMRSLRSDGCTAIVSRPEPYLPQLEEYGEEIEVIFTVLRRASGG